MTNDKDEIGLYSGLLVASFSLAQFCTSIMWGLLSQRFGSKIILCVGLLGNSVCMVLFGLSSNFKMAIITRSISGVLNGNMCICKSLIGEISDDSNAHVAFGCMLDFHTLLLIVS